MKPCSRQPPSGQPPAASRAAVQLPAAQRVRQTLQTLLLSSRVCQMQWYCHPSRYINPPQLETSPGADIKQLQDRPAACLCMILRK
jgi:hypothetical protein